MRNFGSIISCWLLIFGLVICSACSKTPLKADELKYVGSWESSNGSTLEILPNGGGSGKKLGFDGNVSSSKSLSGAQVLVKSPVISLEMMGMSMDYHVNAEPAQVDGKMQMRLDDMDYVKMN